MPVVGGDVGFLVGLLVTGLLVGVAVGEELVDAAKNTQTHNHSLGCRLSRESGIECLQIVVYKNGQRSSEIAQEKVWLKVLQSLGAHSTRQCGCNDYPTSHLEGTT